VGCGVGVGSGASGVTVGGTGPGEANLIAFNSGAGVVVGTSFFPPEVSSVTVRGNSIHSNSGLGIDLEGDGLIEPNDTLDPDTGANNLQNFPLITSAEVGSAIIKGNFNSTASSIFVLDFYGNASCDASGNGEGQTYLGSSAVVTDGSGNVTFETAFDAPLAIGQAVTATATDTAGNTSEFSACWTATELALAPLAGTGSPGDCADGASGVSCALRQPHGLFEVFPPGGVTAGQGQAASAVSPALYWADTGNHKIKKLQPADATGTATRVAGLETDPNPPPLPGGGYSGDGGAAASAWLNGPRDVFIAGKSLYIADTNNCIVRRVDLASNIINRVAGTAQLLGRRHPGRAGTDDRDFLAGLARWFFRLHPALVPGLIDDGQLDRLDGDRVIVDAEYARTLARRRTERAGELGEIVGGVQALDGLRPLTAPDEVVPVRDQVGERATLMAERNAAVHAARRLLVEFFRRQGRHHLSPVVQPLRHRPVRLFGAVEFPEAGDLSHGRPP